MSEEKSLIPIEDISNVSVYTVEGMKPILAKIKKDVESVVTDVTTLKGREEVKSRAFRVTKTKVMISAKGLELIAPDVKRVKEVKNVLKSAEEELVKIAKETRQPLTDWEAAEKIRKDEEAEAEVKRINDIRELISGFGNRVISNSGRTSLAIQETIYDMQSHEVTEDIYGEFVEAAELSIKAAIDNLEIMRCQTKKQEDIAAKESEEAAKKAEEAKAKEEQLKKDSEALNKKAAELKKKEADLKEREDKEKARKKEADDKEAAEKKKKDDDAAALVAKEKLEKEAAAKKLADKEHRAKIKVESVRFIKGIYGTTETQAGSIFDAISCGDVPHVEVKY